MQTTSHSQQLNGYYTRPTTLTLPLSVSTLQMTVPTRCCFIVLVLVLVVLLGALPEASANGGEFTGDYSKLSGIIIPGFASTQLRAWSILDCPYSPLDFNPLDLVWLDTTKVKLLVLHILNFYFICIDHIFVRRFAELMSLFNNLHPAVVC